MTFIQNRRFGLEVAKGNIPGHSIVQLGSRNSNCDTDFKDIWDAGALCTLNYDEEVLPFTAGLTLTGGTSGATARIVIVDDNGATGTLTLRKLVGTLQDNETITDSSTGEATSSGTINAIMGMQEPTGAEQWEVVCESADDAVTGTGATALLLNYMSSVTNQYVTEVVLTNGHTPVLFGSANQLFPRSIIVLSYGGQVPHDVYGKTNQGFIVIRDSVSKLVRMCVGYDDNKIGDEHGLNTSLSIHYKVPSGKTAFAEFTFVNTEKGEDAIIRSLVKLAGSTAFLTVGEASVYQGVSQENFSSFPSALPAGATFKIIAKSTNADTLTIAQIILTQVDD